VDPGLPFPSTLTGQVGREIADAWEAETGRQWTQPLGYSHSIWEVVIDILKRSANPLDRTANRDAMVATNLQTVCGNVSFGAGPHPNVCTMPIFGGQWVKGEKWMYDLKIVDNSVNQLFEPEQALVPMPWSA
jgi:branched-chain amino acid transport system substrate-binding protein